MPILRPHFSVTQLNQYLRCPYSYMHQYIQRTEWPYTPAPLAFGSACHRCIEQFHRSQMNGSTVNLPELFESEWNSTEAQFKDGEKEQMLERGSALMAMFAEQFADIKPQSVEKSFRLPLISPSGVFLQRDIVGVMDCIADDTIIEYKTSAKSSSQKDADESIQLTLYSWAYRMVFGKPEKAVKLVVLVRTRNPKIQVFETQRSEDDYMGAFGIISDVIRAVDLKVFYRNIASHSCDSCVYREPCNRWLDHSSM